MPELLTPGVYFEAVDASAAGITALPTDVAGFVGVAERGPLDRPRPVESWEQFRSLFGEFLGNAYLAYAAKAFFDNGGRRAWFVRVAADALEAESDAAGPVAADRSFSSVTSVTGFVAGSVVTVLQGELRINHRLQEVDRQQRRLIWERPLEPEFDLLLPLAFTAGSGLADVTVPGTDGQPTLTVTAASPGEWGNGLEVRISRSSLAATVTREVAQPLDRAATFVASAVGFEPGTLVRLFQDGSSAREACRVVTAVDLVRRLLTWDRPLSQAFDVSVPISLESVEVGLTVVGDARVAEVFSGLSLVAEHPRYIERVLRESTLIRVTDAEPGDPSRFPARLPDPGAWRLAGGRDGIAMLTPERFTGDLGSEDKRGLRALEAVDEVAMVALPDILIRPLPEVRKAPRPRPEPDPCLPGPSPEPLAGPSLVPRLGERPPEFSLDQVFEVQQLLIDHCERLRDRVAILDPPFFDDGGESVALGEIQAWRRRFDSTFAALYHPWIRILDPRFPRAIQLRPVPPSGHVAGVVARTDLAIGVHKAPANEELRWAQGLTLAIGPEEQGLLNPMGINCLRSFPGRGLRIYGARTVTSNTLWRYLPVRRLLLMIEEAIEEAIQWAVFEPHDVYLRQTLIVAISSFLESLWERGALAGSVPSEAFFVKCDSDNNHQDAIDRGELLAEVGVAPTIPAEFVIVRVGRIGDSFELEEVR